MKYTFVLILAICSCHIQASEPQKPLPQTDEKSEQKKQQDIEVIFDSNPPGRIKEFRIPACSFDTVGSLKPIVREKLNLPSTEPIKFEAMVEEVNDDTLVKDIAYFARNPELRFLRIKNND